MQSSNPQNNNVVESFQAAIAASIPICLTELDELANESEPQNLFVTVAAHIMIRAAFPVINSPAQYPPQLETLAFYLYPHWEFGSDLKEEIVSAFQSQKCLDILDRLCTAQTFEDSLAGFDREDEAGNLARQVRSYTKDVRGTAYPEQTTEKILGVQEKFENWFVGRLGISPNRAQAILWCIAKAHAQTITGWMPDIRQAAQAAVGHWKEARRTPKSQRSAEQNEMLALFKDDAEAGVWAYIQVINQVAVSNLSVNYEEIQDTKIAPTRDEWDKLIRLIGLTSSDRASMQTPEDVRTRPLYVLSNGSVILADLSHALDVIWDLFDQEARADMQWYDKRYQKWKAKWLEERITSFLQRVFPKASVFQSLTYPDPDKHVGSTTELDAAVLWGPFLVLVEGKAKQFRLQSQLGDVARLSSDLAANIEEAFTQGRRALRYIEIAANPEFIEKSTGRKLRIDKTAIRHTYLLTVSLHQFAGLTTHLAQLSSLNLFQDGDYPLAISLPDLDIVTQFCEGPDVFLHYVERRLDVQKNAQEVKVPDELELFGAYLHSRLQAQHIWAKGKRQFHSVIIDGYSELFDAWMEYKRGNIQEPIEIRIDIPYEISELLKELRWRDDYDYRWIAFSLLDLPDASMQAIADFIRQVRTSPPEPGKIRRGTYQNEDTSISLFATIDESPIYFRDRIEERTAIEKYIRKTSKSIGFGIRLGASSLPFEYACWTEKPWEPEEAMEQRIAKEVAFIPLPGTKLPDRNDLCFCGSGIKYKKCCLPRIEAAKRQSHSG